MCLDWAVAWKDLSWRNLRGRGGLLECFVGLLGKGGGREEEWGREGSGRRREREGRGNVHDIPTNLFNLNLTTQRPS